MFFFQVIDPDDLPQRARWTIIATAFLLLIMCLLLVGVTLRMAPIIDDMGKLNSKIYITLFVWCNDLFKVLRCTEMHIGISKSELKNALVREVRIGFSIITFNNCVNG